MTACDSVYCRSNQLLPHILFVTRYRESRRSSLMKSLLHWVGSYVCATCTLRWHTQTFTGPTIKSWTFIVFDLLHFFIKRATHPSNTSAFHALLHIHRRTSLLLHQSPRYVSHTERSTRRRVQTTRRFQTRYNASRPRRFLYPFHNTLRARHSASDPSLTITRARQKCCDGRRVQNRHFSERPSEAN
jgi:hypothetical protein